MLAVKNQIPLQKPLNKSDSLEIQDAVTMGVSMVEMFSVQATFVSCLGAR